MKALQSRNVYFNTTRNQIMRFRSDLNETKKRDQLYKEVRAMSGWRRRCNGVNLDWRLTVRPTARGSSGRLTVCIIMSSASSPVTDICVLATLTSPHLGYPDTPLDSPNHHIGLVRNSAEDRETFRFSGVLYKTIA